MSDLFAEIDALPASKQHQTGQRRERTFCQTRFLAEATPSLDPNSDRVYVPPRLSPDDFLLKGVVPPA